MSEINVQVTQHDPAEIKLCRTGQTMRWHRNSLGRAIFDSRSKFGRAWNPTSAGTRWYTTFRRWIGGVNDIDAGRTLVSKVEGKYYNDNFGDNDRRTTVYHRITLYCHAKGGYNKYVYVDRNGEGSGLLHSHVRTWR